MNGIHDMGGMHGFGPVSVEEHEPVFHRAWEGSRAATGRPAPPGALERPTCRPFCGTAGAPGSTIRSRPDSRSVTGW